MSIQIQYHHIEDAVKRLLLHGFQECTGAASSQYDMEYLYAFKRLGDEKSVYYCCVTVDDLFALLSLVEASASQ